jgi:predicted DNA-binding protein
MSQREPSKKPTSIRLSAEGKELLRRLAKDLGVSMAAALEIAIRKMAEQRKLR